MLAGVFSEGDADVLVGVLTLLTVTVGGFGTASLRALRRTRRQADQVHVDNREDHSATSKMVKELTVGQKSISRRMSDVRADVRDIRADVRDLKGSDRAAQERLDRLEQGVKP